MQGDNICIKDAINEIVRIGQKGIPSLNLISLDPLHVDFINIIQGQGGNSPVNIVLNFMNIDLFGLDQINVSKVSGFDADPTTSKFEMHAVIPRITIAGNYKMNGNMLVLPIEGNGKCNITIDNSATFFKFTPKIVTKNGKDYLQADKLKFSIDPTKVFVYFENLFNGDEILGKSMNNFMNEHWKDIFTEIKPVVDDTCAKVIKNIVNNVFAKFPYNDLFASN